MGSIVTAAVLAPGSVMATKFTERLDFVHH